MNESNHSTKQEGWVTRFWRALITWAETLNTDPLEDLERRVAALEHERGPSRHRSGSGN